MQADTPMPSSQLSRRSWLRSLCQTGLGLLLPACTSPLAQSPAARDPSDRSVSYTSIPRWRGFNLQNKFNYENPDWNRPYDKWDLDFMAEFGFNFVRLPLDYRIWTEAPGLYDEQKLKEIDQLLEWARQRNIHVCLGLHRAPGYCVNPPKEPYDLWAFDDGSEIARKQFTEQWRMFAMRYKHIPATDLSFNLINEPPDIIGKHYVRVVQPAVDAIREQNPERLIIADGSNYGRWPVRELVQLQLAQSTRGYEPFLISHYQAEWIAGADKYPLPTWPVSTVINQYLYGDIKREYQSALVLKGNFPADAMLEIVVQQVSTGAELLISANRQPILTHTFRPGPGQGEWKQSVFQPQWNNYLGSYDLSLTGMIPANTQEIRLEVKAGDWLSFSQIRISPYPGTPDDSLLIEANDSSWGQKQQALSIDSSGKLSRTDGEARYSQKTLWRDHVEPWQAFSNQQGVAALVGEWGAYNHTPHDVVLAWMRDCLANWKQAGLGWALWGLHGSFGVLDSERADVQYEEYKGHKLDRKMLDVLLQG